MPLLDAVISVLAPHNCLVCGCEGKLICNWCAVDAFVPLPSRCYRCKRVTNEFSLCDRCKPRTPLRHVWIRTGYEGSAKDLIHTYKFERTQAAFAVITESMDEVLPYLPADTLIIPVPTATSRVRQRGYDHAYLLASELARRRQFKWLRAVTHLTQSRQVGSSRQQRLTQLADNLVVTKPAFVKGRDVLVVDDVVTTGATLEAMARALKQAGAKSVNALAFAQKQ